MANYQLDLFAQLETAAETDPVPEVVETVFVVEAAETKIKNEYSALHLSVAKTVAEYLEARGQVVYIENLKGDPAHFLSKNFSAAKLQEALSHLIKGERVLFKGEAK